MSETRLDAETRTQFGKGAARKIRRAHKLPAVMYGHGTNTSLSPGIVPSRSVMRCV